MHRRLSALVSVPIVLSTLLAAACDGSTSDPPANQADGGTATDAGPNDGAIGFTCAHTRVMAAYPWGVSTATYLPQQRMTFGILTDSTSSAISRLTLEVWPKAGAEPTIPFAYTFTAADRYMTCENCMLIGEGCKQDNTCQTYFFAQGGHLQVTEAGRSESAGHLRASGSGLTFVEWSMTSDAPVPGGRCLQLTSFDLDTEWGSTGGACSGDPCGAGCCAESPYCSLGNNSIGRFCSDFCGESGDGCTGPNDCCDGYSCFLGTCIVESCGNDTCSAGLDEGGGCCDQAAYCTDGRCSSTCGLAGTGCGGDLDCCTGLACTAGTCQ